MIPWVSNRPFRSEWPSSRPRTPIHQKVGYSPDIRSRRSESKFALSRGNVFEALVQLLSVAAAVGGRLPCRPSIHVVTSARDRRVGRFEALFAAVLETNECVIPWVDDQPFRSKWPANMPTRAFRKKVRHPPDIDSRGVDRRPLQDQEPVDGALLGSRRC